MGCPQTSAERVVHHEVTEHYPIYVVERDGVRYLRFARDSVDQSAVRLDDPTYLHFTYTRTMVGALAMAPTPARVVVVGLGGGTIPMFLRHHAPQAAIDVVEIDAAVARVAEAHLGFKPDAQLAVHVADGRAYLEGHAGTWDVVILDAYGSDNIPRHLTTRAFLEAVRARVAPGGLVVANLWGKAVNPLYPSMLATYAAVFPEVHVLRARFSESRIVVALPERRGWTQKAFLQAAAVAEKVWGLRFDLTRIVRSGYVGPRELPVGGGVLVDP